MKLENASSTGHRHFPVHHIFVKFVFRSFISHHRSTNKFLTQRERKRKGIFSVLHRIPKHICFRLVASIHRWTKDEEKKPIFYQNKIIIISRFDWVPCRITAPEWKKLSKSEHNLFDFYHFCCLTRFFSFLFQAFPISMLFSIYIGAQTSRTFSLHIFFCVRDLCRPVEKFIVCFRTQHAKQWQKSHAFYLAFKCECEAKKVFGKWWFPFSTTCNVLPGNHSTFFFSPFPLFILCVRRRNSPLKLSLLFNRFVHWFNGPFGDIVSDANHFIRSIFSVVCLFRS